MMRIRSVVLVFAAVVGWLSPQAGAQTPLGSEFTYQGDLKQAGVICDFRRPNVIRVAPTPLYNTFRDCWAFGEVLAQAAKTHG